MSIAIGFQFYGGLVLCADTQFITPGVDKSYGYKISLGWCNRSARYMPRHEPNLQDKLFRAIPNASVALRLEKAALVFDGLMMAIE